MGQIFKIDCYLKWDVMISLYYYTKTSINDCSFIVRGGKQLYVDN